MTKFNQNLAVFVVLVLLSVCLKLYVNWSEIIWASCVHPEVTLHSFQDEIPFIDRNWSEHFL